MQIILICLVLGGECLVPVTKVAAQKVQVKEVIAEPNVVVQVDQFGNQRTVVETNLGHLNHAHAFYGYQDTSLSQQNAYLLQLVAKQQEAQSQQNTLLIQLLAASQITPVNVSALSQPVDPAYVAFERNCLVCHGSGGQTPNLTTLNSELRLNSLCEIEEGRMPKGKSISEQDLKLVKSYLLRCGK